jgi:hypothetical protein
VVSLIGAVGITFTVYQTGNFGVNEAFLAFIAGLGIDPTVKRAIDVIKTKLAFV